MNKQIRALDGSFPLSDRTEITDEEAEELLDGLEIKMKEDEALLYKFSCKICA